MGEQESEVMIWTTPKPVLLSRTPAGYEEDCFIFQCGEKRIRKYYGNRLTSEQAKSQFEIDMRRDSSGDQGRT